MKLKKIPFFIDQNNYSLEIFDLENQKLYYSNWFAEFGKLAAEVYDVEGNIVYTITKKFKFWKWKMTYTVEDSSKKVVTMESQNITNTVFSICFKNDTYTIETHYKQQKSVFKNGVKIAEIDQSSAKENLDNSIKVLLLEKEEILIPFLLFVSLMIGDTNQKTMLKSQKTLIPNQDNWSNLSLKK